MGVFPEPSERGSAVLPPLRRYPERAHMPDGPGDPADQRWVPCMALVESAALVAPQLATPRPPGLGRVAPGQLYVLQMSDAAAQAPALAQGIAFGTFSARASVGILD